MDGPRCPNCKHDANIHINDGYHEARCLGACYERLGQPNYWCECTSLRKKEKVHG